MKKRAAREVERAARQKACGKLLLFAEFEIKLKLSPYAAALSVQKDIKPVRDDSRESLLVFLTDGIVRVESECVEIYHVAVSVHPANRQFGAAQAATLLDRERYAVLIGGGGKKPAVARYGERSLL